MPNTDYQETTWDHIPATSEIVVFQLNKRKLKNQILHLKFCFSLSFYVPLDGDLQVFFRVVKKEFEHLSA